MTTGIDVSEHNGVINWEEVKKHIGFAMIRVGYGKNHLDKQFTRNASECERLGIPYGFYWFSYACSENDARLEAAYLIGAISGFKPKYPVAYDFEEDSYNYAFANAKEEVVPAKFAKTFLEQIKIAGYKPMLYTNYSCLNKWFDAPYYLGDYDLWFASWGINQPQMACQIWQKSANGRIDGINTVVDLNICFKDYLTNDTEKNENKEEKKDAFKEEWLKDKHIEKYRKVVTQVIAGAWGNGNKRINALSNVGYDPELVQALVNAVLR